MTSMKSFSCSTLGTFSDKKQLSTIKVIVKNMILPVKLMNLVISLLILIKNSSQEQQTLLYFLIQLIQHLQSQQDILLALLTKKLDYNFNIQAQRHFRCANLMEPRQAQGLIILLFGQDQSKRHIRHQMGYRSYQRSIPVVFMRKGFIEGYQLRVYFITIISNIDFIASNTSVYQSFNFLKLHSNSQLSIVQKRIANFYRQYLYTKLKSTNQRKVKYFKTSELINHETTINSQSFGRAVQEHAVVHPSYA